MRSSRWYIALILVLTICGIIYSNDLIFHADFEDSIDAVVAMGNAKGYYMGNDSPVFVPGKSGKGLLTGKYKQFVKYDAENNINSDEGTLTFWVKAHEGVKWHQNDNYNVAFFSASSETADINLYKYAKRNDFWLLAREDLDTTNIRKDWLDIPSFKEDEWHFFALTWNQNGINVYLDGVLCSSNSNLRMPKDLIEYTFGQHLGNSVNDPNRVMDELKIYKRALNKFEIMNIYRKESQQGNEQIISVPYKAEGIKLNGDVDEWRGSTRIPLSYNVEQGGPADPFAWANLAYDDQYLYFRVQTQTPKEALESADEYLLWGVIRSEQTEHDAEVQTDDCYDLRIIPFDPVDSKQINAYRFLVNGINTKREYSISPDDQIDLSWDPVWETHSDVKIERWSVEGKIPFSAFGKAPKAGEIWGISIFRIWQLLKQEVNGLSAWGSVVEPGWTEVVNNMSRIVFSEKNAVSISIDEAAGFNDGHPTMEVTFFNPDSQSKECQVILSTADNTVVYSESIVIPAEGSKQIVYSDPHYYKLNGSAGLLVQVLDQNQNVMSSLELPVFGQEEIIAFKYYPLKENINVTLFDISLLGDPAELVGTYLLKTEPSMEITAQGEFEISDLPILTFDIDVSSLPEGNCQLEISIVNNVTSEKLVEVYRFNKQELPSWVGNEIGISEKPPIPWTPVEVSGDTISIWGREYEFGTLLPKSIKTQGIELLGEPAYLEYVVDGEAKKIPEGQILIEDWNAVKANLVGEINEAKWSLINDSFVEFDGMVWTDIEFNAKQDLQVDKLAIVFPLKSDVATLFYPSDYLSQITGYLPEEGWSEPIQMIWLGNEEVGIQFFWESDASWKPASRAAEIEVFRDGNKVFLKMDLIGQSVSYKAGEKVRFAFGFMATPVKKVEKFRDWRIGNETLLPRVTGEPDVTFVQPWLQGWSKSPRLSIYPIPLETLPAFEGFTRDGRKWIKTPYFNLRYMWTESPEFEIYKDEWTLDPTKEPNNVMVSVCPVPSYRDFFLHALNLLCEKSHVPGLYFDVSTPLTCYNPSHEEHVFGATNILSMRELIKRIYTKLKEHDPNARIIFHCSGRVYLPILSFADFRVDGENFTSLLDRDKNRGYEHILRLDTFRAEFMGYNHGYNSIFLPEFERAGSIKRNEWKELGYGHADYLIGLTLLHDSLLWVSWMPEETMRPAYTAFERINWGNDWEFIPYWKQKFTQQFPIDEIGISFYRNPENGHYMVVILNATENDLELDVKFDLAAMGLDIDNFKVENLLDNNQVLAVDGEICKVSLPAYSYRLLYLF